MKRCNVCARLGSLLPGCLLVTTVFAQDAVFTYQGRLVDNGVPFEGTGLFKFALVTSSNANHQAVATAHLTGGFVTSCTMVSGGNGYSQAPAVSFSGGGGSGAAAATTVTGGAVTAIAMNSAGSGYTSPPTVTIAPPPDNLQFSTYWSNDGTSVNGSEPAAAVSVGVSNGLFTVVLGDATLTNMMVIDASVFRQRNLQLRVWFNDGVRGSVALSPPQELTPAPYAIQALNAGNVAGTISAASLTSVGNSNNNGGNFFVGPAGNPQTAGSYNTALGLQALVGDTTGNDNTAIGDGALDNLSSGSDNIAVGNGAGTEIFTGNNNIDVGNTGFGDESNTIRIGTTQTKAVMVGISGSIVPGSSGAGVVCVNPSGFLGTGAAHGATLASDLQIGTGSSDYRHVQLGGGNSSGFLYGSFPALADGIHLGYNFYYDAAGGSHVLNTGGATSRLTVGYGFITLAVGGINSAPVTQRLLANANGVTVNGTFNNNSDRHAKQDFAPVNPAAILDKVAQLPVTEWSYKEDADTRHMGPVAQDFHALFQIGTDDKHIAPIDEGGVALAAIQGLNQKLTEELRRRDAENAELKRRLDALEKLVFNERAN